MQLNQPPDTPEVREWRRLRAWELKQEGWSQRAIAAALGVTPGAVSQWIKRAITGGVEALRHQPPPGPQPRLTEAQRAQVPALLARGAEGLWVPWRCLDHQARGRRDCAGIRGPLPSRPHQSAAAQHQLEPAEAGHQCPATHRS
ncbi:MAG: helix-turn-helix domain containing protein [Chloroflexi bacterium]|nr:helix-turn-helix domain containing protein [Chloroflexota bacterium]